LIIADGTDRLSRNVGEQLATHDMIRCSETSLKLRIRFRLKKSLRQCALSSGFKTKTRSRMLADMDAVWWKRLLQLPDVGRNFEACFAHGSNVGRVFHSRVICKGNLAYIEIVVQKALLSRQW